MYFGHSSVEMIGINQKTKTLSMILHLLQSVYVCGSGGGGGVVVVCCCSIRDNNNANICSAPLCNTVKLMK
jgi:hypothetical protein